MTDDLEGLCAYLKRAAFDAGRDNMGMEDPHFLRAEAAIRTLSAEKAAMKALIGEVLIGEAVDCGVWSLEIIFGQGDDEREKMRAFADYLVKLRSAEND